MPAVLLNLLLALLSAALLAASFPLSTPRLMLPFTEELGLGPYMIPALPLKGGYLHHPWLAFGALLPLLLAARRSSPRGSFGLGYLAGIVWLALSWCWLGSFGALPVFLLAGFFALPLGLFGYLAHWLLASRRPGWVLWGLPALWTGLEYLRSFGFWAYPWNLLGYSQAGNLLLVQSAEWGGVFAVSFFVVLANTALLLLLLPLEPRPERRRRPLTDRGLEWQSAEVPPDPQHAAARRRRFGQALCGLGLLALVHAYGALRLEQLSQAARRAPAQSIKLALVQGGLGTRERWNQAAFARALQAYSEPSRSGIMRWTLEHPVQPVPPAPPEPVALPALEVGPPLPSATVGFEPDQTDGPPRPLADNSRTGPRPTAVPLADPDPNSGLFGHSAQLASPGPPPAAPAPTFTATPDNPAYLLVWPESCIPRRVELPLHAYVPGEIQGLIQGYDNCGLLYGCIGHPAGRDRLENGAVLVTSPGPELAWAGSKVRMVPFGELLPFRGAVRFLEYPWSSEDLSEGRSTRPFRFAGHDLAVQVCFDNVWGFVGRRATRQGAEALLLITNNSWYDLPSGIRQHCDFDILRAVEMRRALGRVSTTGWSHLVLPSGRIAAASPRLNAPAVVEEWLPLSRAQSAYAVLGDLFAQACLVAGALLGLRVLLAGRSEGWL